MNKNKLVATGLILTIGVFLTAGCIDSGGKTYKDCGTATSLEPEELKCFNKSLSNCEPAKLEVKNKNQGINMEYLVKGGEPGNCEVTWKIIKGGEEFSKLQGEQITCNITKIRENGLPAISEAYDQGNCGSGTAPQAFNYYLGGFDHKPTGMKKQAQTGYTIEKCNTEKDKVLMMNTGSIPISKNAAIYHESEKIGELKIKNTPNGELETGEKTYIQTTADLKKGETYEIIEIGYQQYTFTC